MDGFNFIVKLREEKEALLEENIALRNQLSHFERFTMNNCDMMKVDAATQQVKEIPKERQLILSYDKSSNTSSDSNQPSVITPDEKMITSQIKELNVFLEWAMETVKECYEGYTKQDHSFADNINSIVKLRQEKQALLDDNMALRKQLCDATKDDEVQLKEEKKYELQLQEILDTFSQEMQLKIPEHVISRDELKRWILSELQKIVGERETATKFLQQSEAEKADLQKKYEEEREQNETSVKDCETKITELQHLNDELTQQMEDMKNTVNSTDSFKQELEKLQKEVIEVQDSKKLLQRCLRTAEEENEQQKNINEELNAKMAAYSNECKQLATKVKELEEEIKKRGEKINELSRQIIQLRQSTRHPPQRVDKNKELEEELKKKDEKINELSNQIMELKQVPPPENDEKYRKLEEDIARRDETINDLSSQINQLRQNNNHASLREEEEEEPVERIVFEEPSQDVWDFLHSNVTDTPGQAQPEFPTQPSPTEEGQYTCPSCGEVWASLSEINNHLDHCLEPWD